MGGSGSSFGKTSATYKIPGTVYKADYREFLQANAGNPEIHKYYDQNHTLLPLYEQAQQVRMQELQRQGANSEPLSRAEAQKIVQEAEKESTSSGRVSSSALYKSVMEGDNTLLAGWSLAYRDYVDSLRQLGKEPVSFKAWLRLPARSTSGHKKSSAKGTRGGKSGGGGGGGGAGGGSSRKGKNKKTKSKKNSDGYGYFGKIDELIRQKDRTKSRR